MKEDGGKLLKKICKIWKNIISGNTKNYLKAVKLLAWNKYLKWNIISIKQLSDLKYSL